MFLMHRRRYVRDRSIAHGNHIDASDRHGDNPPSIANKFHDGFWCAEKRNVAIIGTHEVDDTLMRKSAQLMIGFERHTNVSDVVLLAHCDDLKKNILSNPCCFLAKFDDVVKRKVVWVVVCIVELPTHIQCGRRAFVV